MLLFLLSKAIVIHNRSCKNGEKKEPLLGLASHFFNFSNEYLCLLNG
nr:MAG TPA: hypothetical protein [Caudoviricetes sp.]